MEKKYYWIVGILFAISIFVNIGYSVPAPQRLALNHETNECAMYWAGDEFTYYELPSGWKSYYIDYDSGFVETEIGSCNITPRTENPGYEECCNQLGYTYIPGNIGKKTGERIMPTSGIFLFVIVPVTVISLIAIVIYFIFRKKKRGKNK
jgi:hypothetical protein